MFRSNRAILFRHSPEFWIGVPIEETGAGEESWVRAEEALDVGPLVCCETEVVEDELGARGGWKREGEGV